MRILRFVFAMTAAIAPIAVAVTGGVAHAEAPSPGDRCTAWRATTQDGQGRTMVCDTPLPEMNSLAVLEWQYPRPDLNDATG